MPTARPAEETRRKHGDPGATRPDSSMGACSARPSVRGAVAPRRSQWRLPGHAREKTRKGGRMGTRHQGRGRPPQWGGIVVMLAVLLVASVGRGHARGGAHGFGGHHGFGGPHGFGGHHRFRGPQGFGGPRVFLGGGSS